MIFVINLMYDKREKLKRKTNNLVGNSDYKCVKNN